MARIMVNKNIQVVIQAVQLSASLAKERGGTRIALPAFHKLGYLNDRQMSQNGAQRYSYS